VKYEQGKKEADATSGELETWASEFARMEDNRHDAEPAFEDA